MPRHRRPRPLWFVRRAEYLSLWARYQALLKDHQELLSGPGTAAETFPAPPVPGRYVTPSWAQTVPIPLITTAGLDPEKADALVRRMCLLEDPAGQWGVAGEETG